MTDTVSPQVRFYECANCGAPVSLPPSGGQGACEYCRSPFTVSGRPDEVAVEHGIAEPDRVAALHAQAKSYRFESGIWEWPDGLGDLQAVLSSPDTRAAGLERLRLAWRVAAETPDDGPVQARGRLRLCLVYGSELIADEPLRARAVWETGMGLLSDRIHRDVLRYRLARWALRQGATEAARQWVAACDPRPVDLESETERRLTEAHLAHCERRHADVLTLLGIRDADVPIAPNFSMAACLRAHALEATDRREEAVAVIADAVRRFGRAAVDRTWRLTPGPSGALIEAASRAAAVKVQGARTAVIAVGLVAVGIVVAWLLAS